MGGGGSTLRHWPGRIGRVSIHQTMEDHCLVDMQIITNHALLVDSSVPNSDAGAPTTNSTLSLEIVEHTNNKCVQEEKQANRYAHIFLEPNNRVMLLGACVKPQPLNYLLCTTKLRVFTTPPSSERAGNNVASASKATEAHKALCTKQNARL